MRRLLPVLLALIGLLGGAAAGFFLRPAPEPAGETAGEAAAAPAPASAPADARDYIRLSNQFVVPVVEDGRVASMMILSLGLEVGRGDGETVY